MSNLKVNLTFIIVCFAANTQLCLAENIIASYTIHSAARGWFDTGAGQGYDGRLYDNKKAQTFTASSSGYVQSVSVAAYRFSDATAPLRIRITDTLSGIPNVTLAETFIQPATIPLTIAGKPNLNITGDFRTTELYLEEGTLYGLVFDSMAPEANYRIHGSYEYPYSDGISFRSQNTNLWTEVSSGDLFFEVKSIPPPSINHFSISTNNLISISWTNGIGEFWIEHSKDLSKWDFATGPLTNTNSWSGSITNSDHCFFRIRQNKK